jgi:thioredoxin reductase (NADPH)
LEPTATDALIIGAGPVGLFQVFQLGLQGVHTHVIDALPHVGGQCAELYADKPIYDIPALSVCTGRELVERLQAQIAPMQASFHLGQLVKSLQRQADGRFAITTSGGSQFVATTVFIAAGAGAFVPRGFPLADCQPYSGTQVHHHPSALQGAPDAATVVFGGDELALEWALELAEHRPTVTLLHRRAQLQAQPELLARMNAAIANGRLQFVAGQPIAHSELNGRLCSLTVALPDGGTQELAVDQLLVALGLSPKLGPLAHWGLALERKQIPVNTENFQTAEPGIFAVGDINTYPGKKKLILSGFHEATLAAFGAMALIAPQHPTALEYTTTSKRLHRILGVG